MVKRIFDYPTELHSDTSLHIFSPCFSLYVVANKKDKLYMIKDTYTGQEVVTQEIYEQVEGRKQEGAVAALSSGSEA